MIKDKLIQPHYKNLDGLRCLGSLVIVLGHAELTKSHFGVANFSGIFLHPKTGSATVSLFFVLSGFLITSLLLTEQKQTGNISFRNFYLRRIFRLWPLYFIYVGVFYLVMQYIVIPRPAGHCEPVMDNIFLFLLLHLSNFVVFLPRTVGLGHLWSIGVEEQFYLLWPLVVKFSRHLLRTVMLIVAALAIGKLAFSAFLHFRYDQVPCGLAQVRAFLYATRYECIALGALGAVVYHQRPQLLTRIYARSTQWISVLLAVLAYAISYKTSYIDQVLICIPFSILILNMATNPQSIIRTDRVLLNRLGKLSYGMYIWHPLVILIVMNLLLSHWGAQWTLGLHVLFYLFVLGGTLLVATLSYRFIEKPFLRLKPY